MRVVSLTDKWESTFWKHVNKDPLDYYFLIFDWTLNRSKARIFLALNETSEVAGLMLIYCDQMVQVRGNREAVRLLIDGLDAGGVELSVPADCRDIVLDRYSSPALLEKMTLMYLKKGQESLRIITVPLVLEFDDAEAIALLMREAYPEHWGGFKADNLRAMFNETIWLGIKDKQKLVSIGVATLTDAGSHIMFIATHKQYRNCGYATSIVSALTQQILEKTQTTTIHVINDNTPAIKAYSKVGFKPYKSYLFVKI